jgi:ABC-2 type transport system permease protein
MIRWRKATTVAWFELSSTVRRVGYLIVTLGMPLFAILYGGLALIPGYLVMRHAGQGSTFGVVDQSGRLGISDGEKITVEKVLFKSFGSEQAASAALREKRTIRGYFVVPEDYLATGRVMAHSAADTPLGPWQSFDELGRLLRTRLLEGRVTADVSERVVEPVAKRETFRVRPDGSKVLEGREAIVGRLVLPLGFVLLLFTSILMSGSYLIQATATEKENRVIEVLLSSASADEVMTGKLLGLGGAGLLQVMVWIAMMLGVRSGFSELVATLHVQVSWQAVALSPVLFVGAYLFLGSLMLGTGSLGGNVRESQQLGMLWAFAATVPLLFLPMLIAEPHGPIAHFLTWLPFSAPATLVFRMSIDPDGIAFWETVGSLVMLVMSTWLSVRVASRLFRIGLLLTGGRPRWRDVLRQARP